MKVGRLRRLGLAKKCGIAALFLMEACGLVLAQSSVQTLQQVKTVFVIALENHDWTQQCPECGPQQIFGNPAAPFLNSLVTPGNSNSAQVSYATAYYSAAQGEHPSEPNYILSEAGTDFGSHTDNDPSVAFGNLFSVSNHLCSKLSAAGIAWKSYQEDVQYTSSPAGSAAGVLSNGLTNPYNGSQEYYYAVKHNPMEFFTDTQDQNVFPFSQLWMDLSNNTVGSYNWITPDEFNEMHSYLPDGFLYNGTLFTGNQAAIAQGDNCLSIIIPQIMASAAYQDNGAIIIWMDETESTDDTNTTLPEIIISPLAKGNAYASTVPMSHFSDLKTMHEIFGLLSDPTDGMITLTGPVNDLSDMFQPASCGAPIIASSFTNLTLDILGNSTAMIDVTGTNYIVASSPCGSALTITQSLPPGTPLAGGTTNEVVLTVADSQGNVVYSTNWVTVTIVVPPVIVEQPASVTNTMGAAATFQVGVQAVTPLRYQWYFGANRLVGQTNATLRINAITSLTLGVYHVVITSVGSVLNSAPALLAVTPPSSSVNNNGGPPMRLTPYGFQWSFSGQAGQTYRVLASDDLTVPQSQWAEVGNGTFGASNVTFTDPDAADFPSQFYVVVSP